MDNENTLPGTTPPPPAAPVIIPAGDTALSTPPAAPAMVQLGGDLIAVPHKAFEGIKKASHTKGAKEATAQFETKAKEAGFESFDAMMNFATTAKKSAEPATPPANPAGTPPVSIVPPNDVPSRYAAELAAAQGAASKAQADLAIANDNAAQVKAEADTRVFLVSNGVKEIDYTLFQLGSHMATLTPEQSEQFNPAEWLNAMKAEKPFLFAVTATAPATTLPPASNTPATPPSASAIAGANGTKPATEWSKEEVAAAMKRYGVTPTVGM